MVKAIACPEERERSAAQVLAALPDWFGLPESTAAYVRDSRDLPFWADVSEEGEVRGFIALRETSPYTGEVYVMGVMPQYHRRGVGRALFRALYAEARRRGYEFLQVKTVREGCYPRMTGPSPSTGAWASGSWSASRSCGTPGTPARFS